MKVLHLTTHLNIGGITSYLNSLCLGQKESGVTPIVASSMGNASDSFSENDISLLPIPLRTKNIFSPKILLSLMKLSRRFTTERWDIIHAHTRVGQYLAHLLSSQLQIPYVTTFHGFYRHRWMRKISPCLGHQTIAISNAVADDLKKNYPRFQNQIHTILHGIQHRQYSPNIVSQAIKDRVRKQYGIRNHLTIGMIGRLSPEKGHSFLLDVFKTLQTQHANIQLLIAGDGRERETIRRKINKLHLQKSVFLLPTQHDPRIALSLMDLYVTCYTGPEGLGLSLLEAMSMAKPVVISYTQGGMGDLIDDGEEGFIIKNATADQMTQKIDWLLRNGEKRKEMGKKASDKVDRHFSYKRMAKETITLYGKALGH